MFASHLEGGSSAPELVGETGNGSWSPKGDLGLLGDLFLKTGLLWVSFLSKSLLFGRKLSKYGSFKGFRQNRWRQEYGAKVS